MKKAGEKIEHNVKKMLSTDKMQSIINVQSYQIIVYSEEQQIIN